MAQAMSTSLTTINRPHRALKHRGGAYPRLGGGRPLLGGGKLAFERLDLGFERLNVRSKGVHQHRIGRAHGRDTCRRRALVR